jgi:hypothetical protein
MPIELPSRAVVDYLKSFNIAAVFIIASRAGIQIGAGRELPSGCASAWWCQHLVDAKHVVDVALACDLRRAPRRGPFFAVPPAVGCAAVEASAARLGIALAGHDATLAKARACVGRLDAGLARAKAAGDLRDFNREFQRRRRMAGGSFPSYQQMLDRYRTALASSIAGSIPPGEIIRAVFGERS